MAGSPTHPFPFKALQPLQLPRDGGLLADVGERQWMQPAMMHAQPSAHKRITRVRLTHGLRVIREIAAPLASVPHRHAFIAQTCQTCAISVVC